MQKKHLLLMAIIASTLSACASLGEPDLSYTAVRPMEFGGAMLLPGGELQDEQDFQLFFRKADYVLIGETHTNMTDHLSQALILEKMAKKRLKPVLGLEMVEVDSQYILDRFNSGELSVDQLGKALNWSRTVGYSFELYRPIFETAAQYKIPAYALNIPRRVVREARLKGIENVQEQDKKYLPGEFIPASEAQRDYLLRFFSQHAENLGQDITATMPSFNRLPGNDITAAMPSAMAGNSRTTAMPSEMAGNSRTTAMPNAMASSGITNNAKEKTPKATAASKIEPDDKSMLDRNAQGRPVLSTADEARTAERQKIIEGFLTAQAVWDSAMAERATRIHKTSKRTVVIIAGQGHVEYSWGIAQRLAIYDPSARVVTVMPWRAPMESVFMLKQGSPLQDAALPEVFPPADLADIYFYSPLSAVGKAPQGMVTGQDPEAQEPQLIVLSVVPKSVAEKAGILAGDIILQVERRTISNSEEFYSLLAQFAAYGTAPSLTLKRGEAKLSIVLPIN